MKNLLLLLSLFSVSFAIGMDRKKTLNPIYPAKIVKQPLTLKWQAAIKIPHDQINQLSPELRQYVRDQQKFFKDIERDKNHAINESIDQTYLRRLEQLCADCHDTASLEDLYSTRPHVFTKNNNHGLLLKKCVDANNLSGARWFLEKIPVLKKEYIPYCEIKTDKYYLLQFLLLQTVANNQNQMATLLLDHATDSILNDIRKTNYWDGQRYLNRSPYQFCALLAAESISKNNFKMLSALLTKFPSTDLSRPLREALSTNNDAYLQLVPHIEKEFKDNRTGILATNYYNVFKNNLPYLYSQQKKAHEAFSKLETIFKNQTIKDTLQPEVINCLKNVFCHYHGLDKTESYAEFLISLITPNYQDQLVSLLNSCLIEICSNKTIWNKEILTYLKFVLGHGADTLTTDANGKIPLQLLLEKPSRDLITPPIEVLGFGRHWHTGDLRKAVKHLLKEDGQRQVTHTDNYGNTPLHTASASLVIDQLLDHGGNINLRNNNGETPSLIFVKENIKDWGHALCFYGDGHRDYDGQWMKSDLHEYSQKADHTIPDRYGNTVLGYLSTLKTNSANKYFANTVINLFKNSKKRVHWEQHTSQAITNATFKALARKKTIGISLDFSNNLAAAQAFRDKKGNFIPAPKVQMEDVD